MKKGLLASLLALFLLASVQAGEQEVGRFKEVKCSLIHAQSEGIEETVPVELLFGYTKYRILGETRSDLPEGRPVSFEPHPMFFVKLSRTPDQPNCYDFELIQKDKSLVKGKYIPKKEVPLIIRGPFYDQGNLVLVIEPEFDAQ